MCTVVSVLRYLVAGPNDVAGGWQLSHYLAASQPSNTVIRNCTLIPDQNIYVYHS